MFPGLVMIYLFHLIQPSQTIETSWTPRLTWLLCHHINITPSLHYNITISILVCWSPQQVVDGGLGDGSKNPPITNLQNYCQEIFKEKNAKNTFSSENIISCSGGKNCASCTEWVGLCHSSIDKQKSELLVASFQIFTFSWCSIVVWLNSLVFAFYDNPEHLETHNMSFNQLQKSNFPVQTQRLSKWKTQDLFQQQFSKLEYVALLSSSAL